MVVSSLTSSKYWGIGENYLNRTHLRPNRRLSQKQNQFSDVFTMVQKSSNRHIQAVVNNLKFIILGYLTARNLGFWTDIDFLRLVHKQSLRHVNEYNTLGGNTLHTHTQLWSMDWNRGAAACLERYVQRDMLHPCVTWESSLQSNVARSCGRCYDNS